MSREMLFSGAELRPGPAALWIFTSKVLPLPSGGNPAIALYPPPGPVLVEWFLLNADVNNDDLVYFGSSNVSALNLPGFSGITALSPGEWLAFEPNDKGLKTTDGLITAPDFEIAQVNLIEDQDLLDVSQFWIAPGSANRSFGPGQGSAVQATIGQRNRR